jgi:hypothetical protein
VLAGPRIVEVERPPEPPGLDPHDRVGLRVEMRRPAEGLGGDRIALDLLGLARQGPLDDEGQEADELRRVAERLAPRDALQRGPNLGG